MNFTYNDGGRSQFGFKGTSGDCVARSIAIASGMPYDEIYNRIFDHSLGERRSKRGKRSSPSKGVFTSRKWFNEFMAAIGFKWVPCMQIGSGCKVHLRADELPQGRLVVSLSKHLTAVIDGVIHDTHDQSRNGTRCVYGYWRLTS